MAGEFNATQGAQLLTTYISKKWIPALERDLQAQKFTTKVIIPAGQGKVGRVVTFSNPPGSTSALGEGTLGNAIDITTTGTNITIAEYGEYMHITTVQEYASPTMRDEVVNRFSHGGMVSIDSQVIAQGYTITTNLMHCLATQAGASTTAPATPVPCSAAAIMAARKKVKDVYATGFTGIEGHPEGHFAALLTEQAELDIVTELTTGRMYWSQAVTNVPGRIGQEKWVNGYVGSIYGTAVYSTQNLSATTFSGSTTMSANLVLARGCIAAVAFKDMTPQVFVNTPSANSTDNPFRNFASISWYVQFSTKIHDVSRGVKLYSGGF